MKSNSVIFFTENVEANSNLIKLYEGIATVSVCGYNSQTWEDVDLYAVYEMKTFIVYIPETSKFDQYVISQSQFRVRCNEKILPEYMVYSSVAIFATVI